jgi:C1A family cysteine protease
MSFKVSGCIVLSRRLTQTLSQIKGCLASGWPFVFGSSVYESAPTAGTGHVPLPASDEAIIGRHAAATVGYDNTNPRFFARKSFGNDWGPSDYFTLPCAYLATKMWPVISGQSV